MSSRPTGTLARRRVARGDRIPDFAAPTADGGTADTRRYYLRRNLALVFTHRHPCAACREYLHALAEAIGTLRAEAAEVVAVVPLGTGIAVGDLARLPFPVALAEGAEIHGRYGLVAADGAPLAAVVIADQTGTVYEVAVSEGTHGLLAPEEIGSWLEFVSYQCPECWVDRTHRPGSP